MAITIKVLKQKKKKKNLIISNQTVFGICIFSTILKTTTTQIALFFDVTFLSETLWQSSAEMSKRSAKKPYSIQSARCFLEFTPIFFFPNYFFANKRDNHPTNQPLEKTDGARDINSTEQSAQTIEQLL